MQAKTRKSGNKMQTHAYICMYLELRIAKNKGITTSCLFDFFVLFSRDLEWNIFTYNRLEFAFTHDEAG